MTTNDQVSTSQLSKLGQMRSSSGYAHSVAVGFPALVAIAGGLITFIYGVSNLYGFLHSNASDDLLSRVGRPQAEIEYALLIVARLVVVGMGTLLILLGSALQDRKSWSRICVLIIGIISTVLCGAALLSFVVFQREAFKHPDGFLYGLALGAVCGLCWTVSLFRKPVRDQFIAARSSQATHSTDDTSHARTAAVAFILSGALVTYLSRTGDAFRSHVVSILSCLLLLFLPLCYFTLTLLARSIRIFVIAASRRSHL